MQTEQSHYVYWHEPSYNDEVTDFYCFNKAFNRYKRNFYSIQQDPYPVLQSCRFQNRFEDELARRDFQAQRPGDEAWKDLKCSHLGLRAVRTFYHSKLVSKNSPGLGDCTEEHISDIKIPLAKGLRGEYQKLYEGQDHPQGETAFIHCGLNGKPQHVQLVERYFWPAISLEQNFYLEKAGILVESQNSADNDQAAIREVSVELGLTPTIIEPWSLHMAKKDKRIITEHIAVPRAGSISTLMSSNHFHSDLPVFLFFSICFILCIQFFKKFFTYVQKKLGRTNSPSLLNQYDRLYVRNDLSNYNSQISKGAVG